MSSNGNYGLSKSLYFRLSLNFPKKIEESLISKSVTEMYIVILQVSFLIRLPKSKSVDVQTLL